MAHAVPAHLYLVFDMHDVLEGKSPKLYLHREAAIAAARAHIEAEYQGGEVVVEMLRSLDASAATPDSPGDQVIAGADYADYHVWVMPCPVEGRPTLYMGEHQHRHGSSFYLLEGENLTVEHLEAVLGEDFEPELDERLIFEAADPIMLVDDTVISIEKKRLRAAEAAFDGYSFALHDADREADWVTFEGSGAGEYTLKLALCLPQDLLELGQTQWADDITDEGLFSVRFEEGSADPSCVRCTVNGEQLGYDPAGLTGTEQRVLS